MSTYIMPESGKKLLIHELEAPQFLKDYIGYLLTVKNLAHRTVNSYYIGLRWFLRWADARTKGDSLDVKALKDRKIGGVDFEVVSSLSTQDIYEYLSYIDNALGNAASSRSARLSALRSFYEYFTVQAKRLNNNPVKSIPSPKKEKHLPKYLTEDESVKLLEAAKTYSRDYCMVMFLLNCGMRVTELVGINVEDIRDGNVLRLYGKGRKERIVYLNDACLAALSSWLDDRALRMESPKEGPLFIAKRSTNRITTRGVEMVLDKLLLQAGLSRSEFSPHKLRHTCATHMYQSGSADLLQIKTILGHENVGTTQIYAHVSDEQIKEAMLRNQIKTEGATQEDGKE